VLIKGETQAVRELFHLVMRVPGSLEREKLNFLSIQGTVCKYRQAKYVKC